jgi:heme exporter protein B
MQRYDSFSVLQIFFSKKAKKNEKNDEKLHFFYKKSFFYQKRAFFARFFYPNQLIMTSFSKQVWALLRKELQLEWRQRYAIGGILLYVVATVVVVYMSLGQAVGGAVWGALFWVVILFASVNAVAKSFMQENQERQLYYYLLASPSAIIVSKTLYNVGLLQLISLLAWGVFAVVLGYPIVQSGLFGLTVFLGALGFAIAFTFVSAIAAKAQQSATLMAILSFPVIIPILLVLLRLTKIAANLMVDTAYYQDVVMLLSIDAILFSLVLILFPYLWRD